MISEMVSFFRSCLIIRHQILLAFMDTGKNESQSQDNEFISPLGYLNIPIYCMQEILVAVYHQQDLIHPPSLPPFPLLDGQRVLYTTAAAASAFCALLTAAELSRQPRVVFISKPDHVSSMTSIVRLDFEVCSWML